MSSLEKLFNPGNQKFYNLFEEEAGNLRKISGIFKDVATQTDKGQRQVLISAIEKLERQNDKLTHKLIVELAGNFITPFDREDIHGLSAALDSIADYMLGVSKHFHNYNVVDAHKATLHVAEEMIRFSELLEQAIKGLRNRRALHQLTEICVELRSVTHACDAVVDEEIADLFGRKLDRLKTIICMDHYSLLQDMLEITGEAVNVLEAIIIKYG